MTCSVRHSATVTWYVPNLHSTPRIARITYGLLVLCYNKLTTSFSMPCFSKVSRKVRRVFCVFLPFFLVLRKRFQSAHSQFSILIIPGSLYRSVVYSLKISHPLFSDVSRSVVTSWYLPLVCASAMASRSWVTLFEDLFSYNSSCTVRFFV